MARAPICGYTLDAQRCGQRGEHFCAPRAERVAAFFAEALVHTKGRWARQPFVLTGWQRAELADPIFGPVVWSEEWECYRRLVVDAYLELARKQGKSEFDAGVALLLTCADDEESAEVYGCAEDVPQARKVFDVAVRMVQLSPVLSKRLNVKESARRIIDDRTGSYYEVVPADAAGNLGHNPHGVVLDEAITQPSGGLWEAMTTAAGARVQPLFLRSTTAGKNLASWAGKEHVEAVRVAASPERAPHRFVFMRNTPHTKPELEELTERHAGHPDLPVSIDPFDERNWKWSNPALGEFLSIDVLRREATDAKNDPTKENGFRQFRGNQWVSQASRFLPMDWWDDCAGEVAPDPEWIVPKLEGRACWGGLDLSAKLDLTAWCLSFADGWAWWRFWLPEAQVPFLDEHTGGQVSQWAQAGWIKVTEGDVIDYDTVYGDIEVDHERFAIAGITYDPWSTDPVVQEIQKRTGLAMTPLKQTYEGIGPAMAEAKRMLKDRALRHGANPVARWHADALEAKSPADNPDVFRPVKPNRQQSGARIDGMPAWFMSIAGRMAVPAESTDPFFAFA